jgi:L-ascorbate metabolism protein UlaG (beta-lactamase superfamily)
MPVGFPTLLGSRPSMTPAAIAFGPNELARGPETPLRVRWLGTAGFEITCGEHVLLLDPYITRAPLLRCVFGRLEPDLPRIARYAPRADAIVVGHTHFDHALDVPAIAQATGAVVFGSRSAAALCRGKGVPEGRIRVVERSTGEPPAEAEVGPFHLRFLPSAHSRLLAGRVPFEGDIQDCDDVPLRANAYRCGAVFAVEIRAAGRKVLHVGSAELTREVRARDVDLVLLCASGWTSSEALPSRVMRAFEPRAIVLSHWDEFFSPIEAPARVLPAIRFGKLADELHASSRDARVGTLPLLGDLHL